MEAKNAQACEEQKNAEVQATESQVEQEHLSPQQQADREAQEAAARKFWSDKYAQSRIRSIEMRNLIFEALSIEDEKQTPRKQTFKMYRYCGCIEDLRVIVEFIAIKRGLIPEIYKLPNGAWGSPRPMMHYASSTNFNNAEDKIFGEEFHQLVYHNVIAPGAPDEYGDSLPYFHVTESMALLPPTTSLASR